MASYLEMMLSDFCSINLTSVSYWGIVKVFKEATLLQFGKCSLWYILVLTFLASNISCECLPAKWLCHIILCLCIGSVDINSRTAYEIGVVWVVRLVVSWNLILLNHLLCFHTLKFKRYWCYTPTNALYIILHPLQRWIKPWLHTPQNHQTKERLCSWTT